MSEWKWMVGAWCGIDCSGGFIVKKTSNCHMHVLQNLEFLGLGVNNILPKEQQLQLLYSSTTEKDTAQNVL